MSREKGFYLDCENDECEMALLDGYDFGDTLLEGVMFEVRVNDGKMSIGVSDDDADYLSDLNTRKWLKEAALNAVDSDMLRCSLCDGDVIVYYDGKPGYEYDSGDLVKFVRIIDVDGSVIQEPATGSPKSKERKKTVPKKIPIRNITEEMK